MTPTGIPCQRVTSLVCAHHYLKKGTAEQFLPGQDDMLPAKTFWTNLTG